MMMLSFFLAIVGAAGLVLCFRSGSRTASLPNWSNRSRIDLLIRSTPALMVLLVGGAALFKPGFADFPKSTSIGSTGETIVAPPDRAWVFETRGKGFEKADRLPGKSRPPIIADEKRSRFPHAVRTAFEDTVMIGSPGAVPGPSGVH